MGSAGGGRSGAGEDGGGKQPPEGLPRERCGSAGEGAREVKLVVDDPGFDLEKAVCSHGLFMMAPNRWDPATRTFQRPLRLRSPSSSFSPLSVVVRISHPHPRPSPLHISVFGAGAGSLSSHHHQALLAQVRRMLRISEEDGRVVEEFHRMHPTAKERGFGRVFRSPTLFEDMVKCILLCNCQWSRTLSMARALCDLQLELKGCSTGEHFQPTTPQQKELKGKHGYRGKVAIKLEFAENESEASSCRDSRNNDGSSPKYPERQKSDLSTPSTLESSCNGPKPCQVSNTNILAEGTAPCFYEVGNFPSPEELAALDENFLAKRCGLGYRAKRILSLAQGIVENKIQLEELEEICDTSNPSSYEKLNERLSSLDGFGPFTCANVLMCMGFYHKVPADSETLRHLKKFHLRRCTVEMVEKYAEDIYGDYAPFQFLAYWSELWNFYEQRFGKLNEMSPSDYQLITAKNMKDDSTAKKQRMKRSLAE